MHLARGTGGNTFRLSVKDGNGNRGLSVTTCRDILADAYAALGVIAFGGEPTADEIEGGLTALSRVMFDLHAARCAMTEIDVENDWTATENQRVRVQAGAQVVITLPNSVIFASGANKCEASLGAPTWLTVGASTPSDGIRSRPPIDGSRIEVVGVTQGLYFYRADINAWIAVNPLSIDGPAPLNARYDSALTALVAERLSDPMNVTPSSALVRRIARGNAILLSQPAQIRAPSQASFL